MIKLFPRNKCRGNRFIYQEKSSESTSPISSHLVSLCLWCETWKGPWPETESSSLKWLGMWLHGASPNLRWVGQTPRGLDCGSWYVSKNRQHPPTLFLLCFTADADLCLSSEGSNYWVRGKDAPPFNKPTSNHPMTDGPGAWLMRWTERKLNQSS